jgi:hypothetical protein
MKNHIICNNCKTENPFYELVCSNCKSYLRDRIYNIDIGNVLARLIESPTKAFKIIIFSEHKNFITFLIILLALKLEIDAVFISLFFKGQPLLLNNFIGSYFAFLVFFFVFFFLFSYLIYLLNRVFGYVTRVKDYFASIIYSFVPFIFALIILFPLELLMFGEYLFSTNPSPFALKEFIAYSLLILEVLIIIWSIFLFAAANYTQTKNLIYSISISLIFNSLLFFFLYSIPKII